MEKLPKNSFRHFPADMFVLIGLPVIPVAIMGSCFFSLIGNKTAIYAALGVALVGAGLLFWAKLPLYRAGIYFSFGPSAIQDTRRNFYYWGIGLAIAGCVLALILMPLG